MFETLLIVVGVVVVLGFVFYMGMQAEKRWGPQASTANTELHNALHSATGALSNAVATLSSIASSAKAQLSNTPQPPGTPPAAQ